MRERLELQGEGNKEIEVAAEKLEKDTFERRTVRSPLEGPNGEHADLKVAVSQTDGALRHANFWDLDKTLLFAEPFHEKAVEQIFPEFAETEEARKELHRIYFAGFKLGNSYREWDRMWRMYGADRTKEERETSLKYEDPKVYKEDFMKKGSRELKLIDEPGHPEGWHERANEILQRYGKIAYGIMKAEYDKSPENFQRDFVKPEMIQLIEAKTRLGQANIYMTANQRDFARGLVTFSGLWKYGLDLATDEDMAGGGKEIAIKKLTAGLENKGLQVKKERASAIGDSIAGDVGSGTKHAFASGVLVTETSEEIKALLERVQKEDSDEAREIRSILEKTHVEAIPSREVTKSSKGIFRFGKRSSKK